MARKKEEQKEEQVELGKGPFRTKGEVCAEPYTAERSCQFYRVTRGEEGRIEKRQFEALQPNVCAKHLPILVERIIAARPR